MTQTIDEAIADLSSRDGEVRNQALGLLVSCGRHASPVLVPLLDSSDPTLRVQASRALSQIADPATADRLARMLDDGDPQIRAQSAWGLFLMRDRRALDALIRTIDDFPHAAMVHSTPSTDGLIAIGEPALPRVAELLGAPSPLTRERARFVIVTVADQLPPEDAAVWRAKLRDADPA